MRAQYAVVVLAAGLLTACSPTQAADEPAAAPELSIPSTVGGTVPVPTVAPDTAKPTDAAKPPAAPDQATAPPPAAAGPVSSKNLPPADKLGTGWKTYVDEGGAEAGWLGNKTWTRERSPHQAAYEALPVGCVGRSMDAGPLPVPLHALQATYRTARDQPATVLLLRFANQAKAQQYYAGYQLRMTACGVSSDAQLSVRPLWQDLDAAAKHREYAGDATYVDVSARQGATVALLAATEDDTLTADWARSVAPVLRAVIDSA